MGYDYSSWIDNELHTTQKKVLKTIDSICEDADKERLTSSELDDLLTCWSILTMLNTEHKVVDPTVK